MLQYTERAVTKPEDAIRYLKWENYEKMFTAVEVLNFCKIPFVVFVELLIKMFNIFVPVLDIM